MLSLTRGYCEGVVSMSMLTLPKFSGSQAMAFESLNAENRGFIATCESVLKEAPRVFSGDADLNALKARLLEKKRLRKIAEGANESLGSEQSAQRNAVKQLVAMVLHDKGAQEHVQWAQKIQDDLSRSAIWAGVFRQVPVFQQTAFCRLQQGWQYHATFAAFSHAALMVVAFDIVPAIAAYLQLLQTELKLKSPSLFGKAGKQREYPEVLAYAASLSDWLSTIQRELAYAMAGRLLIGSDASDLRVGDVCITTVNALKTMGALKPEFQMPPPRYALTPTQFNAFHDVIARERPSLVALLQAKATWLKPDASYHSAVIDKQLLIIPKRILPLMPTSKRGRANATISSKETLVDYLAKRRHLLAETRLLNRPIAIHDDKEANKASEHLKALSVQMDKIASELNTLTILKPVAWWARWFQRSKLQRLNALSDYWLHAASQLLDVALDALTQWVQRWQVESARTRALSPITAHTALIRAITRLSQQADSMGVATATQKTAFARLQQRTFKLYEQVRPETARMQACLDELARSELKSSAQLLPLTNYLDDLRHQADSTEFTNFLKAAKPAVATLLKTTTHLLRRLAAQGDGLTAEEYQSLEGSVHGLLQLGNVSDDNGDNNPGYRGGRQGEDEQKALKNSLENSLAVVWRAYLSRLAISAEGPTEGLPHAWFTQCENTLHSLYTWLGDTLQANGIKSLQQERAVMVTSAVTRHTVPLSLQQTTHALLADIERHDWKSRCRVARDTLIETLWLQLDGLFTTHKAACHRALERLIQQAAQEKRQSLRELPLEPHHQSLLELTNPTSPRLRLGDKLIWAMQLAFDGAVDELKQRHALIEQQQTLACPPAPRWGFFKGGRGPLGVPATPATDTVNPSNT